MVSADVIVFDMDGVLADVTESYRAAIQETVRFFTGVEVPPERVQDYKNAGGWNNDWALSRQIVLDLGVEVPYETVVEYFQSVFFNGRDDALILREKWVPAAGLLERLSSRYGVSIFTGRPRPELEFTLQRSAPGIPFDPIVTCDDVTEHKPHPEGLLAIAAKMPDRRLCYVGDTIDDARCARLAGVPFIGIAAVKNTRLTELEHVLRKEGAAAILRDVNEIEKVLAQ